MQVIPMPNRLIEETSPYLLQHAHNPVDWYPWGEEALRHAREQGKPIFLSIGYSACHWCHVMEHESFESAETAKLMNENFINIKVDREERPDLDQVYMTAVQHLTGSGGWPLTVFLTPEGKPFYGGTYFPPEDREGLPGLRRLLQAVAQAYGQKRNELARSADQLQQQLQGLQVPQIGSPPTDDVLDMAYSRLQRSFDYQNGGFGTAPKFPQPMIHEFLLRYYQRTRASVALQMVELSLTRMARGGIYDQVGGGFHRYSTDAQWLVPHFEKMLYDNALLSRLYLHVYQATGKAFYRQIAQETLDYVLREMTLPLGGFGSAQDADSEGVEGRYYVWTTQEIANTLGKEAEMVGTYYGVTPDGNFEGKNILHVDQDPAQFASGAGLSPDALRDLLERARQGLLAEREKRGRPGRDEKALTAWNGLMMGTFAEASNILARQDYRRVAESSAAFLLRSLKQGRWLLRSFKDGQAKVWGYLDDYAALIDGLLALHEATFQHRWLAEARSLADTMIEEFWDEAERVFFDSGRHHEALFIRPRDVSDNVMPSGSSHATQVLLRLAAVTGKRDYAQLATAGLHSMRSMMLEYPAGTANWLCATDFYLSTPKEIAIIGPREDVGTQALLSAVYARFLPNKVLVGLDPTQREQVEGIPLLEERGMLGGRSTAYVCQNYTCLQPVAEPEELSRQLGAE